MSIIVLGLPFLAWMIFFIISFAGNGQLALPGLAMLSLQLVLLIRKSDLLNKKVFDLPSSFIRLETELPNKLSAKIERFCEATEIDVPKIYVDVSDRSEFPFVAEYATGTSLVLTA